MNGGCQTVVSPIIVEVYVEAVCGEMFVLHHQSEQMFGVNLIFIAVVGGIIKGYYFVEVAFLVA